MGNLTAAKSEMDKGWFLGLTFPCTAELRSLAAMAALFHPIFFFHRLSLRGERKDEAEEHAETAGEGKSSHPS